MSTSPYISQSLRNYLTQFKIQELVNRCINDIAIQMPQDPYSFIVNSFQQNASLDIQIQNIKATEVFSSQMMPVLSVKVQVIFMGKSKVININPFGIANDQPIYFNDEDRLNGKGLRKGIQFIEQLNTLLKDKVCSKQADIDNTLLAAYETKGNKGLYQVNICSYLSPLITSSILNRAPFQTFKQLFGTKQNKIKVCINCLQGSKLVGSKCKVFKFMLICEDLTESMIIVNIIQSIRKTITSGKGGQLALKYSPDGTFICPADTIIDNLKIVEQAINTNSALTKDKITIGISWNADNFYNVDQKKYELQNPKALLDINQLIDYYFKLCTERPSITYIEDPIFSGDTSGWNKILKKFQGSNIRIGSRKIFSTVDALKNNLPVTKQDKPELQQAQIQQLNNSKVKIHSHWYKPFELLTLSKLIDISRQIKKQQSYMILSQNQFETTDTTLVDLCYATGSYINMSSPLKFNQISKLNRILQLINNNQ